MTAPHCPVLAQVRETNASLRRFSGSMRKLRRLMRDCRQCSGVHDCPLRDELLRSFVAAVQRMVDEWQQG
jgi:hypothetical protein